jgi:hypothetical protein
MKPTSADCRVADIRQINPQESDIGQPLRPEQHSPGRAVSRRRDSTSRHFKKYSLVSPGVYSVTSMVATCRVEMHGEFLRLVAR